MCAFVAAHGELTEYQKAFISAMDRLWCGHGGDKQQLPQGAAMLSVQQLEHALEEPVRVSQSASGSWQMWRSGSSG